MSCNVLLIAVVRVLIWLFLINQVLSQLIDSKWDENYSDAWYQYYSLLTGNHNLNFNLSYKSAWISTINKESYFCLVLLGANILSIHFFSIVLTYSPGLKILVTFCIIYATIKFFCCISYCVGGRPCYQRLAIELYCLVFNSMTFYAALDLLLKMNNTAII